MEKMQLPLSAPAVLKAKALLVLLLFSLNGAPGFAQSAGEPTIGEVFRAVSPAVVKVHAYDANGELMGRGSGFIVDGNGLIVTNYHVVQWAHQVQVTTKNNGAYWVEGLTDLSRFADFAILKIPASGLPTVRLGLSGFVDVGDPVIAIGHPKGLDYSASDGIVSQWRQEEAYRLIQHTASISPGSSGGPLLNRRGEVIGINSSGITDGNELYFALPISYVNTSLSENRTVKWSLDFVARWQAEEDRKDLERQFAMNRDSEAIFEVRRPTGWQVQQDGQWNKEGTVYTKSFLMAPPEAHRAVLHGYLSEGIRIHVELPKRGYSWPKDPGYLSEWANRKKASVLKANAGFAVTDSSETVLAGQTAKMYAFVGENTNITEPEKTTFYFIARPEYRVSIEVVSPVSKFDVYRFVYDFMLESFALVTPEAPAVYSFSSVVFCGGSTSGRCGGR
jgi:hypothetical protein